MERIVLDSAKDINFELLLVDARREAVENGLTEAMLEKLLDEED